MTQEQIITLDNVVDLYRATIAHDAQWLAEFDACSFDDQMTIACEELGFDPDAAPAMTREQNAIIATGGFNTGRLYTQHGQRIYWAQRNDGWLFFNDIDRMISGWTYRDATPGELAAPVLPGWVMGRYDNGNYEFYAPGQTGRNPSVPADFDFGAALRI